jgi:4-hydroxythreonine-4-phosphate dehydrogenase
LALYSSDAFARGQYEKFDAGLAMYHDQGLIPFKSLATGEGVNYTTALVAFALLGSWCGI